MAQTAKQGIHERREYFYPGVTLKKNLAERAQKIDTSKSNLVRAAVDSFLKNNSNEDIIKALIAK